MKRESVFVTLIVGLRPVSFDVPDPAFENAGDTSHDLGLCALDLALYAGQVCVADLGGEGESAQAVAAEFAPPSDFGSVWLHNQNDT
nr:hypothetical protein [Streptomyces sp. ISL-111]